MATVSSPDSDIELNADEVSDEEQRDSIVLLSEDELLPGWKRILQLPFEPIWAYSVLFLGCCQTIMSIFAAGFKTYGKEFDLVVNLDLPVLKYASDIIYLLDVALITACKNIHGLYISPLSIRLPNWVLIMDILSIIPLEFFIPMDHVTPLKAKLYYMIELNDCLKMARILYYIHINHIAFGNNKMAWQLFEFCFNMTIAISLGFAVTYNIMCYGQACGDYLSIEEYIKFLYISVSKITAKGFTEYPDSLEWMFALTIGGFLTLILIVFVNLAHFTLIICTKYHHKYYFLNKLSIVQLELNNLNVSGELIDKCIHFYKTFWEKHQGYRCEQKFMLMLPPVMHEEIALDTSWYALKHSRLFRDMDIPFLRYISEFITQQFTEPEEILYDKDFPKDKMVYVISGVIQILSEEDGETPILSFSGGTSLGGLSLMLSCNSKATVSCKTICELQILDRKTFLNAVKLFPKQWRLLRRNINKRLSSAKDFHKISNMVDTHNKTADSSDVTVIMMLKNTLHRLMVKDGDTSAKHECQNIFLRSEFSEDKFKNKYFTGAYLDMLAISERLELVTDTVFLKTSCPCILQPDSMIIDVWEALIIILAVNIGFLVPYFAFVEPSTPIWYSMCVTGTTFIWLIDLYVQASIAVKTADEIIATVKGIFAYRTTNITFLIEVVAALPLELLACICLPYITGQTMAILELNRTFKIWRLYLKLEKWENQLHGKVSQIRYFKYTCMFIYLIFICSCLMYSMNCYNFVCIDDIVKQSANRRLFWNFVIVTQIVTGTNVATEHSYKERYFTVYMLLTVISSVMYVTVYASIAAIFAIKRFHDIKVKEAIQDIITIIHTYPAMSKYRSRILNYVETQWIDDNGVKLLHKDSTFSDIPLNIYQPLKEDMNLNLLLTIPLFKDLPKELISDLCVVSNNRIFPPNEVICYAGEISNHFHIIRTGFCKIVSTVSGIKEQHLGPNESVSVVETCLHIKTINTVVTTTHCRVLTVTHRNFMRTLAKHSLHKTQLENFFSEIKTENQFSLLLGSDISETKYVSLLESDATRSFRKFGYNLKLDSFEEYDYYVPFDRLDFFSFFQYILLRYTILPNGKFLFMWETVRCTCAVLSSIIFCINFLSTCSNCVWIFFRYFLDAMAWIDIYIRLHICYYNKNGMLVTHPLKTATHYLTGAFIVDLFASFPTQLFLFKSRSNYNRVLAIIQLNRVIQMYRFFGFTEYIRKMFLLSSTTFTLFKYIPLLLTLCISISALIVNQVCTFDDQLKSSKGGRFEDGVICVQSWKTKFISPLSSNRIQAIIVYLITTLVTQSGMLGFTTNLDRTSIFVAVLSIAGYVFSLNMVSAIIGLYTLGDSTLLKYQDHIRSVKRFMSTYNVNSNFQKQLIRHFEQKWYKKRGKDLHDCISRFNLALKQDILYDVYGSVLQDTWVFFSDSKTFLRSLLLEMTHAIIMKNGYITTINDVNKYLIFLLQGEANVLAADGTKLATLGKGSMFGNLDNCPMVRQMVSVVASVNVEILTIEAVRFHAILKDYRTLQKRYQFLTAIHVDYLEGKSQSNYKGQPSSVEKGKYRRKWCSLLVCSKVFDPKSVAFRIWEIFILTFVCYIEILYSIYQIAVRSYPLPGIIFQYSCDLLYLINYYVKMHTTFRNELGEVIKDVERIRGRMYRNRLYFWFEVVSIIPFDAIAWSFSFPTFYILHSVLRTNRLFRLTYIIKYFKVVSQKIDIDLFHLQALYTFLWFFLLMHFCTCFILIIGCTHTPNMHPEIECTSLSFKTGVNIYIRYFFVVFSCFSGSSQELIYPESWPLLTYFVFLMVALKVTQAMVLATVYSTLQMVFVRLNKYSLHLQGFLSVLQQESVSHSLLVRTLNYFTHLWTCQMGTTFPTLLIKAPYYLREAILNDAFGYHINKHFIFEKCHGDFNRQIVACLRNITYFRGDYVVLTGSIDRCIYIIHRGSVIVIEEDKSHMETTIGILKKGSSFGTSQFLIKGTPCKYTFRAIKPTVILTLRFDDCKHIFQFYQASEQMIFQRYSEYQDPYS